MAVGDIIQVTFVCQTSTQAGLNIRHWRESTTLGSGATLQELADAIANAIGPSFQSALSNQAQFRGVVVQKIFPSPPGNPVMSTIPALTGSLAGDILPKQVAGLVSLRTALGGRNQRGRNYIPFPAELVSDVPGVPSTTYRSNILTIGTFFIGNLAAGSVPNTSGYQAVLWHRTSQTFDALIGATVPAKWATQRRRGDFGAPNIDTFPGLPIV